MNTNTKINGSQAIAFRVSASGPYTSVFSSSGTGGIPIKFNTEELDTDGAFNTTTYEFTVPKSGIYLFNWSVLSATQTFGFLGVGNNDYVYLYKNGTAVSENTQNESTLKSVKGSIILSLAAGDVIKLGTASESWYYVGAMWNASAYFEGCRIA